MPLIQAHAKEKRNKNDEYITPPSMVGQLLEREKFDFANDTFLEPCCDARHITIPRVLWKHGAKNVEVNIYEETGKSFLDWDEDKKVDIVISNTPYGNKNTIAFINKAKKIAKKKVVLLYPLTTLNGKERFEKVWSDTDFPLTRIYQFIRFANLKNTLDDTGNYEAGMVLYAWFVFDVGGNGKIELIQIDNSEYLI